MNKTDVSSRSSKAGGYMTAGHKTTGPTTSANGTQARGGTIVPKGTSHNQDHQDRASAAYRRNPSSQLMAQNAGVASGLATGRRSKKGLLMQGKSQRQLRALSTRPLIHIRDGKLLLSGP